MNLPFENSQTFVSNKDLLTIKMASQWASDYINKNVTPSNIAYLFQYGRVRKITQNGSTFVSKKELKKYYDSFYGKREVEWKNQLGDDLDWHLSFDYLKEAETTKHVHRLHPYKGKFIPQLVEYFLNDKTDEFKREVYFKKGDIVLDPFCGSGTTLVQANELGMHAVGIDISAFNSLIGNVKVTKFDLIKIQKEVTQITEHLRKFLHDYYTIDFDQHLAAELSKFNVRYFPSPEFKRQVARKEIDESKYAESKLQEFLLTYHQLVDEYAIDLLQKESKTFLDKWYLRPVREEIDFVFGLIERLKDKQLKKVLGVILSRTIRSCRATTHADLATLKEPVSAPYYCAKHGKICKPLFSIQSWWETYSKDTIARLAEFEKLRTETYQYCLTGDSQRIDIVSALKKFHPKFSELVARNKINGIFSSPPYVGLIDYHEQHAYAYDLFGFKRNDEKEIGRLFHGQGRTARECYVAGIAKVLRNCKKFLVEDYNVFLVANDKYNLYPDIADKAGMKIVNKFKRPVLNRTENDKGAYSEVIFHLKERLKWH